MAGPSGAVPPIRQGSTATHDRVVPTQGGSVPERRASGVRRPVVVGLVVVLLVVVAVVAVVVAGADDGSRAGSAADRVAAASGEAPTEPDRSAAAEDRPSTEAMSPSGPSPTSTAPPTTPVPAPPTTVPAADDVAVDPDWCASGCDTYVSARLDHARYGSGTFEVVGGPGEYMDEVRGAWFRSDDTGRSVVWAQAIGAKDVVPFDGIVDTLGHAFLAVSFGGPGARPLVFVPTADGFDDLRTIASVVSNADAPFYGSDYKSPYGDVDGDGTFEIINMYKTCDDDCTDFTWTRNIWTWDGRTYVQTTFDEPTDPPEDW